MYGVRRSILFYFPGVRVAARFCFCDGRMDGHHAWKYWPSIRRGLVGQLTRQEYQWSTWPAHSPDQQWFSTNFEVLGRTDWRTDKLCENSDYYSTGRDCGRPRGSKKQAKTPLFIMGFSTNQMGIFFISKPGWFHLGLHFFKQLQKEAFNQIESKQNQYLHNSQGQFSKLQIVFLAGRFNKALQTNFNMWCHVLV